MDKNQIFAEDNQTIQLQLPKASRHQCPIFYSEEMPSSTPEKAQAWKVGDIIYLCIFGVGMGDLSLLIRGK